MKNVNRLLVIGFVLYWAVSFFGIIPDTAFSEKVKNNTLLSLVFPPKYTMYTNPPKVTLLFNYKFYDNDELIDEINQKDFISENIKSTYPFGTKKYFLLYSQYFAKNQKFTYLTEQYFFKEYMGKKNKLTFPQYVQSKKQLRDYINNTKLFSRVIVSENPHLKKATHVIMDVIWHHNSVSFDPRAEKRFSSEMADKIILSDTIQ